MKNARNSQRYLDRVTESRYVFLEFRVQVAIVEYFYGLFYTFYNYRRQWGMTNPHLISLVSCDIFKE